MGVERAGPHLSTNQTVAVPQVCVCSDRSVNLFSNGGVKEKRENRCQSGFLKAGSNDSRIVHFCAIKSKTYRVTLFLITMAGLCLKTNQNKS